MSGAWADNQVYWATLAYARWWLAVDGPFLGAVYTNKGFTEPLLRRIAVRYNVNRGLLQPKGQTAGGDASATGMIGLLSAAANGWPDDLEDRAARCVHIAETALDKKWTKTLQVSGVSKFMWFLKPDGWTLFDRFAVAGMKVPVNWSRRDQFEAFYEALADASFNDVAARIERTVLSSSIPNLHSSRILDSLLMARGARGSATHEVDESRTFLGLLPPAVRDDLHRLAIQLQVEIGNDVLPPMTTKRKKS